MLDFSNYSTKSKYYNDSNKLAIGKMKDQTTGVTVLFLIDDNSEHKKAKGVNGNVIKKITDNEYKDVLLNNKCLRQNRTQSKDHRIGTYEVNKVSLSSFDDKIYIQNNRCDGLPLGYQR